MFLRASDNECSNLQVWFHQNHQSTNQVNCRYDVRWNPNETRCCTSATSRIRREGGLRSYVHQKHISYPWWHQWRHLNPRVLGGYSSHLIIIISSSTDFPTQRKCLNKSKSKVSFRFFLVILPFRIVFILSKYCRVWIEQLLQMVPQQDAPLLLLIQSVTKLRKTAMVLQAERRNWFKINAVSFKLPLLLATHSNNIHWLYDLLQKFSFLMTNISDKSHHLNVDPQPFLASTQAERPKTISQASTIVSVSSRKNPCEHA